MITVYKYEIDLRAQERDEISEYSDLQMPSGAELLSAGCQILSEVVAVWARVDTDAPLKTRRIRICGTGHPAPPSTFGNEGLHLATIITAGGALVWHVFDGGER